MLTSTAALNPAGLLAGVPYLLKDLFDIAGLPTRAGSAFLTEVRPTPAADCQLVRTLRAAGAACAGKTHLHEFAYGITGENPHYGDCEHPQFPGRTTGGSSSGSAAAVSAGIVPFAIGTDTGGSVRLPAAFCGLFGFRLTPHDRFIADAIPLASSFDTAGWFTANAEDMHLVTRTLCGIEPSASSPRGCYLARPGLDAATATACLDASRRLGSSAEADLHRELTAVFSDAVEIYSTLVAAEAWQVHKNWFEPFRSRYDPFVWNRLDRARTIGVGEIERARNRLAQVRETWSAFFRDHDFLVLPAAPFGALTKPECTLETRNRILTLTAPASLGGRPVLTVPVALPSGLTTGLQVVVRDACSPVVSWALAQFGC